MASEYTTVGEALGTSIDTNFNAADVVTVAGPVLAALAVIGIILVAGPAFAFRLLRKTMGIFS